jgi:hypothetical protein
MRLSAPKQITWLIALIVGVVGIVVQIMGLTLIAVPFGLGFWLVVVAFVLLLVATMVEGL